MTKETVSSRASQGDISTEGRINKGGGRIFGDLPFITSSGCLRSFLFVCSSFVGFSSVSSLFAVVLCLLSQQALCVCSRESAPGSRCDKVMRGDVVIQQFQPKGHICSPSFALCICLCLSLPLLPPFFHLSIYLLNTFSAVSAGVPVSVFTIYIA